MTRFDIAHVSDLHFGNPAAHMRRSDVDTALDAILNKLTAPASYLIVSGDITYQGQKDGYEEAARVIKSAIERRKLPASHVFVCPGNHDIVKEDPGRHLFASFDAWSSGVRSDKHCTFADAPARLIQNETGDFLLMNTAYHANCKIGLIELASVKKLLAEHRSKGTEASQRLRVAVFHHHLIPVLPDDLSTTRNAYDLIGLLDNHGFSALLHGHQHAILNLHVGKSKMLVSGVGSFGFLTAGYMNSVAIYRGEGGSIDAVERYGLTLDSSSGIVQILSA